MARTGTKHTSKKRQNSRKRRETPLYGVLRIRQGHRVDSYSDITVHSSMRIHTILQTEKHRRHKRSEVDSVWGISISEVKRHEVGQHTATLHINRNEGPHEHPDAVDSTWMSCVVRWNSPVFPSRPPQRAARGLYWGLGGAPIPRHVQGLRGRTAGL